MKLKTEEQQKKSKKPKHGSFKEEKLITLQPNNQEKRERRYKCQSQE